VELVERIETLERRRCRDPEGERVGDELAQRHRQRGQRAEAGIDEQLRLQRRTEPRLVVEQGVHVLQTRVAHVSERDPGHRSQAAAGEIVGQRGGNVGDSRAFARGELVDDADPAVAPEVGAVPGLDLLARRRRAVRPARGDGAAVVHVERHQAGVERHPGEQVRRAAHTRHERLRAADSRHRARRSDCDQHLVR
jgi:hypothetical protein